MFYTRIIIIQYINERGTMCSLGGPSMGRIGNLNTSACD